MQSTLSDAERNAKIEAKKKEVIERLCGKDSPYPIEDEVECRYTSTAFEDAKKGKSFYTEPRIHGNAIDPASSKFLGEYNHMMHVNGGRYVTHVEDKPKKEIPPPVK